MMERLPIERRGALGMIAGGSLAALAATPGVAQSKAGSGRDPLQTYMLMRGALDDRLVIGCVQAQYFGVIDGAMTPLFGVAAATFSRYRPRAGGGYEAANGEVSAFTDLRTGEPLDAWANPYTGETVAVPKQDLPPATFAILPDMTFQLSRTVPGMSLDHRIQPMQLRGEDVWVPELTITSATIPGQRPFRYSELTTLHARRSELFRPGAKQVGADTSFTNIVSWRPWMKMGDRPGNMMSIGAGRYGATMATVPPALITAIRQRRPELLTNPGALIAGLWT